MPLSDGSFLPVLKLTTLLSVGQCSLLLEQICPASCLSHRS